MINRLVLALDELLLTDLCVWEILGMLIVTDYIVSATSVSCPLANRPVLAQSSDKLHSSLTSPCNAMLVLLGRDKYRAAYFSMRIFRSNHWHWLNRGRRRLHPTWFA
jgi:hypothetical protein